MLVKARCEYCNSEDLRLIDMVYGKGTLGERIEKGFKCNSCDEELDLDEVIFEEIEELIERKIKEVEYELAYLEFTWMYE